MTGLLLVSVSFCTCSLLTVDVIFLIFSHFCGKTVYEQVTKNAVRGLWARRSRLNLVGAHINVFTGEWTQKVTFLHHVGPLFSNYLPLFSNYLHLMSTIAMPTYLSFGKLNDEI